MRNVSFFKCKYHHCLLCACLLSWVHLFGDPMDCSPPGSSVPGIFQARILNLVTISFSREFSQPRYQTRISCVSCIAGRFFTCWDIRSSYNIIIIIPQIVNNTAEQTLINFVFTCIMLLIHTHTHTYIYIYTYIYVYIYIYTRTYIFCKYLITVLNIKSAINYFSQWKWKSLSHVQLSPDQNTGVCSLSLLKVIFPVQGSNPSLLHCRWILYQLSYQGSLFIFYPQFI